MVAIYENNRFIGIADNERIGNQMIKDQFSDCSRLGYFSNSGVKGLYKNPDGVVYPGIKGTTYEFISTCNEDPEYRVVPIEPNTFLPGCEKLPTTVFNP